MISSKEEPSGFVLRKSSIDWDGIWKDDGTGGFVTGCDTGATTVTGSALGCVCIGGAVTLAA